MEIGSSVKINDENRSIAKVLGIDVDAVYEVLDVRKQSNKVVKIAISLEGIEQFFHAHYFDQVTVITSNRAYDPLESFKNRVLRNAPPVMPKLPHGTPYRHKKNVIMSTNTLFNKDVK